MKPPRGPLIERTSGRTGRQGYTHAPPEGGTGSGTSGEELSSNDREYSLDLARVVAAVKQFDGQRIGIQFPAGLRDRATEAAQAFEAAGLQVLISADPCYGACDLADREMQELGADLLVHFGHYEHPHLAKHYRIPVYFVPVRSPVPLEPAVDAAALLLGKLGKRIGVTTTAQHADKLDAAIAHLQGLGFDAKAARGDARLYAPGQVVGCNVTCATRLEPDVDAFLYLGSGLFHPIAIALTCSKPLICSDPFTREAFDIAPHRDRFLRQRWAAIARSLDATRWGILVSTKTGQMRTNLALQLKKRLEATGREAHVMVLRDITPDNLLHFRHLDAFVAAACPRVPIDDANRYAQPILTAQEIEHVLKGSTDGAYAFDQIRPEEYDASPEP